jgi:endonuclease/exonuclease/phosphatase family metal-dependent hydrolase
MPWYNDLRPDQDAKKQDFGQIFPAMDTTEKIRILENLLTLRKALNQDITLKKNDRNLLVASWNIKEFGQMLDRIPESYYYIGEIISKFDLIAVQEIKNRLTDLLIIMRLLGKDWAYLINDITEGTQGNSERFAYIYDQRRVNFSGLAGEIVLWDEITSLTTLQQLKRTPYITGFTAGWKSFAIINVHLNPGNSPSSRQLREREVRALVEVIKTKISKKRLWTENLMIMGDFNLYQDNTDIVRILEDYGFFQLDALRNISTNVSGTESYDKIFYRKNKYFNIANETGDNGGVFRFFEHVYQSVGFEKYKNYMLAHKDDPGTLTDDDAFQKYFVNYWRKNQMSDHYPIWVEMIIDSTDEFLQEKLSFFQENS